MALALSSEALLSVLRPGGTAAARAGAGGGRDAACTAELDELSVKVSCTALKQLTKVSAVTTHQFVSKAVSALMVCAEASNPTPGMLAAVFQGLTSLACCCDCMFVF